MTTARELVGEVMRDLRVSEWRLKRGAKKSRYEALVARRKLVRRAFDMVRHNDAMRSDRDMLLAALVGPSVPESAMHRARQLVAQP